MRRGENTCLVETYVDAALPITTSASFAAEEVVIGADDDDDVDDDRTSGTESSTSNGIGAVGGAIGGILAVSLLLYLVMAKTGHVDASCGKGGNGAKSTVPLSQINAADRSVVPSSAVGTARTFSASTSANL